MVLQPSEERRRSGSHYTPRALTEPIVRTTLEPILERLRGNDGKPPRPGSNPRSQGLRPGDGFGAPSWSKPAAISATNSSSRGTRTASGRRSRRTKTK
jgi:hypothetical protein